MPPPAKPTRINTYNIMHIYLRPFVGGPLSGRIVVCSVRGPSPPYSSSQVALQLRVICILRYYFINFFFLPALIFFAVISSASLIPRKTRNANANRLDPWLVHRHCRGLRSTRSLPSTHHPNYHRGDSLCYPPSLPLQSTCTSYWPLAGPWVIPPKKT